MKNIAKLLVALLVVSFTGSCTSGWLDINNDPNVPTVADVPKLLSSSEKLMSQSLGQGNFIGNNLSSYVHQLVSREVQNYGMAPAANGPFNSWNYAYIYAAVNFDAIIQKAEPEGNLIYAGVAKTLKAYIFSMLVDLWGDVPFSEFNVPNLLYPKPDASSAAYNSLLTLLESGLADLQNTTASNLIKPSSDDFFYAGNVAKWVQLNNTIKLKLLLQSRKAKTSVTGWQAKFDALIAANNFMASGNDFEFWYTAKVSPDERHPAFIAEYASSSNTYWISPYFYEIMKGQVNNATQNPLAGVNDPRVPYYFYNQLATGQSAQSNHEYRNGNFLSIFFASNGSNSAGDQARSATKIGIYACGGKYDAGTGGAVSSSTGNGAAPHKMITYAAYKFMMAELASTGETTGNARQLFKEAMEAAIAHVNTVVTKGKQASVPLIANADRDTFVAAVLAKYDAAGTPAKQLEIIMTQKWIANFFNPVDSYTDYRRTGYPQLFNPANTTIPGSGVNLVVTANSPAAVPINPINSFPRSLFYPTTSEADLNPNITQKGNLATPFVFWDK